MQHCKTSVAESHVWIEAALADERGIAVCWDSLVDHSARRELQESTLSYLQSREYINHTLYIHRFLIMQYSDYITVNSSGC